ncbi:MAG: histidine kinase [Anaerolineae bacterium]|nr:histidine kinase [Anaerolineae bacterium]
MDRNHGSIMIATLGGQPQLVTFALDELLARGENIHEVIVPFLSAEGSRVNRALDRLSAEFVGDYYLHANHPCRLRPMPIRDELTRLPDIQTEADANATWEMLRDLIITLKNERQQLHVCVSGGRRVMALVLVSAALLHFNYQDKMWHIYTPEAFLEQAQEGAMMHARPEDGVRLIQVPLVPLGTQFPILRQLAQAEYATLLQPDSLKKTEQEPCQAVWAQLSLRQREVLRLLADGQTPQEVADTLAISIKTLDTHKTAILAECRVAWGLPDDHWLDYHFLRDNFGPFLRFKDNT